MAAMRTIGREPMLMPNAAVDELDDEYIVHLPVPGFALDELDVQVADGVVTVSGDQAERRAETRPFCLHEQFVERFGLPEDADTARVTASFAHGELELHAPRTNGATPGPHSVPITRRFALNADVSGV